jgi:hypothetical protein
VSADLPITPSVAAAPASPLAALARREVVRYARHPLFLIGLVLLVAGEATSDDPAVRSTYLLHVLLPAFTIGVLGIVVEYRLARGSDRLAETSGSPSLGLYERTLGLVAGMGVPLLVGLLWFVFAVVRYTGTDTPPDGFPFGGVGDAWAYGVMFSLGVVSCVGGPVVGLLLARWFPRRGIAVVTAVLLVIAVMVMQGNIESLRFVRVVMPFTWFGNQFGVPGDDERMVILTGSPLWYSAYLVGLCVLGILVALYRDRERPRDRLRRAIWATLAVTVVLCGLAMTQGVQETMVNPVPTGQTSAPG